MSAWLNDDELIDLTGYSWRSKQQLALAQMRIPFRVNPRGRVLVNRDVITGESAKQKKKVQPDWSLLEERAA